jgi:hypothetical protein
MARTLAQSWPQRPSARGSRRSRSVQRRAIPELRVRTSSAQVRCAQCLARADGDACDRAEQHVEQLPPVTPEPQLVERGADLARRRSRGPHPRIGSSRGQT